MFIFTDGTLVPGQAWVRSNGLVIEDRNSPYNKFFCIVLPYTQEQKEQWKELISLKNKLISTDYQTNKYIEGEYSEEEWAEKKAQRAAWRNEIREIEKVFVEPTITREEMNEAERKALEILERGEHNADS